MNRSALPLLPLLLTLCWAFTGCDNGPIPFLNKATPTPAPITPTKKAGDWMWDSKRKSPLDKPKNH